MSHRLLRALLACMLSCACTSARADDHAERAHAAARDRMEHAEPAARIVDSDEAARLGYEAGPAVRGAERARRGADGLRGAAHALLHVPNVWTQAGYRQSTSGSGPELTVGLSQEIPLRGVGSSRRSAVSALTDALDAGLETARADSARRAALGFVSTIEAAALLSVRDRAVEEAARLAQVSRRRVDAGVAQPIEASLGQGEHGRARAAHIEAEGLLIEAAAELAVAIGRDPTTPPATPARFGAPPAPVTLPPGALERLSAAHPHVRALEARARWMRSQVGVARAISGPTATAGLSYQREGNGDQVALGQLSVGVPVFDPAGFDAAERRVEAAGAEGLIEIARAEARKEIHLARHDTEHFLELYEEADRNAIVPAREAVRLAERNYTAGTDTIEALLFARQRLLSAEELALHARAELARAHVRLAYATGRLGAPL